VKCLEPEIEHESPKDWVFSGPSPLIHYLLTEPG
jgi:hypothetical protein